MGACREGSPPHQPSGSVGRGGGRGVGGGGEGDGEREGGGGKGREREGRVMKFVCAQCAMGRALADGSLCWMALAQA